MQNSTCSCPGPTLSRVCSRCGRNLCGWHSATQPEIQNGKITQVQICAPSCDFFTKPVWERPAEWRPS